MGMDTKPLSKALRQRADSMDAAGEDTPDYDHRDAELIRCLARMVEGKDVYRAFGAPGDWGYNTPIGAALKETYNS